MMGAWESEPDELDFEAHGLKCAMRRGPGKHWCGYVGVPAGHPAFDKHYDAVDVLVHGGLTFSRLKKDGLWWLGFDCAHGGDLCPLWEWSHEGTYRDAAYVRAECESLARQLALLTAIKGE